MGSSGISRNFIMLEGAKTWVTKVSAFVLPQIICFLLSNL
jgi:hypothetical protein